MRIFKKTRKLALSMWMAIAIPLSLFGRVSGNEILMNENQVGSFENYETVEFGVVNVDVPHKYEATHFGDSIPMQRITFLKAPTQPQREGTEYFTVTPMLKNYPLEKLQPCRTAFAISVNDSSEIYESKWNDRKSKLETPFTLPGGEYDFVFFFWGGIGCDGVRCIIKENIEVTGNMEITPLPSEATQHITFRPLLANGERFTENIWENDEIVRKGNCGETWFSSQFSYKNKDLYFFSANGVDYVDNLGERVSGSILFDMWITPTEKISVMQIAAALQEEEGISIAVMGADGLKPQEVTNNPLKFSSPVTAQFIETSSLHNSFAFYYFRNGIAIQDFYWQQFWEKAWEDLTYRVCLDPVNAPEVTIAPQFMTILDPNNYVDKMVIVAPLYDFESDTWNPMHQSWWYSNNQFLMDTGKVRGEIYPRYVYNPDYSIPNSDDIIFGDNTPITVFLRPGDFDYSFVGRYGEVRTIDLLNHKLSVKCDGEELCSDPAELNNFFWTNEAAQKNGNWTITIENNNVVVDGLESSNHCEMNFIKGPRGVTPTVMHFMMRGKDGEVTDRFDEANGELTFYAGDFEYNYEFGVGWWYTYQPLEEVKVAYAPYGSEVYTSFDVVEDPDKFFMPGYGAYYSGNLNQIDRRSETGWYDVKISITDAQGNSQVQTVSPAFKIDSLTGISEITADENVRVVGNNIFAPDDSQVYNLNGVEVGSTNLPDGIYIVHTPEKVVKVVIK